MALMTPTAVKTALKSLKGWRLHDGKEIRKEFPHKNFVGAMGFVNAVAILAERSNHHPDIDIRYSTVLLSLSTHSEGGVTEKDITLAREINNL